MSDNYPPSSTKSSSTDFVATIQMQHVSTPTSRESLDEHNLQSMPLRNEIRFVSESDAESMDNSSGSSKRERDGLDDEDDVIFIETVKKHKTSDTTIQPTNSTPMKKLTRRDVEPLMEPQVCPKSVTSSDATPTTTASQVETRIHARPIIYKPAVPLDIQAYKILSLQCFVPGCAYQLNDTYQLVGHLYSKHRIKKYRCPHIACDKSFFSKIEWTQHLGIIHAGLKAWECYICSNVYSNYFLLHRHLVYEHYEGRFECAKEGCYFHATTRAYVYEHYRKEHPKTAAICITSTDETTEESTATCSLTQAQTNNKYSVAFVKCLMDNCAEFFLNYTELNQHLKAAHQLLPILCPVLGCRKSFDMRGKLDHHFRSSHNATKQWRCGKCALNFTDRVFDDPWELYTHAFRCHQEGNFKCAFEDCGRAAKYRGELIAHYDREHVDEQFEHGPSTEKSNRKCHIFKK